MAGDWIKMRTSLLTNPKVNGIARILEDSREVSDVLSTGYSGPMNEIVTRNVMRHVTVSSLLVIWGAANEHTHDGIFHNADLSDIDDMVGIPGFGAALVAVGWAVYDEDENSVTLPNFHEYNTASSERSATAKSNAERQKEYRDRKKANAQNIAQESNVTHNVTSDVTSNRREEKRREEEIPPKAPTGAEIRFERFWAAYPKKVGKDAAARAFAKRKVDSALLSAMLEALTEQKRSEAWTKDGGQFVPNPATWLNQGRWQDEIDQPEQLSNPMFAGAI